VFSSPGPGAAHNYAALTLTVAEQQAAHPTPTPAHRAYSSSPSNLGTAPGSGVKGLPPPSVSGSLPATSTHPWLDDDPVDPGRPAKGTGAAAAAARAAAAALGAGAGRGAGVGLGGGLQPVRDDYFGALLREEGASDQVAPHFLPAGPLATHPTDLSRRPTGGLGAVGSRGVQRGRPTSPHDHAQGTSHSSSSFAPRLHRPGHCSPLSFSPSAPSPVTCRRGPPWNWL